MASFYKRKEEETQSENDFSSKYLVIHPENGGFVDIFKYVVLMDENRGVRFLESSANVELGEVEADHRWVIVVSILARTIIALFGKPMEFIGYFIEFLLNILSENGSLLGLLCNILRGNVVMPRRGSKTFLSTIGHLDGRIDLYKGENIPVEMENRALMDLCVMASKLAYENPNVVRNVILHHWKMHFVDFFNCWNDFQEEMSTQVFILTNQPTDADLILISFRGTEPYDTDDWSTDFDYSWYEVPNLGKVHMGFLEALGLGNRKDTTTFRNQLQRKNTESIFSEDFDPMLTPSEGSKSSKTESEIDEVGLDKKLPPPEMVEKSAYYAVRSKLRSLLKEHKNAKFMVTGHSLGGALAILFPTVLVLHEEKELMGKLLGVYTFGQPRIGNRELGRFMEEQLNHPVPRYFRIVYCNDLVPRLPYDNKTFLYKHFGACLYYDSRYVERRVDEMPNRNFFGLRYLIPEHLNAVWELFRSLTMGYAYGPDYKEGWFCILLRCMGLALPGISAHCLTDYVNCVRLGSRRRVQMRPL